jgi:hypothetical protein
MGGTPRCALSWQRSKNNRTGSPKLQHSLRPLVRIHTENPTMQSWEEAQLLENVIGRSKVKQLDFARSLGTSLPLFFEPTISTHDSHVSHVFSRT